MKATHLLGAAFLLTAAVAGCGREGGSATPPPGQGQAADGSKYLLAVEPSGGKGVAAVRKESKDGDEVVVVGQVLGPARSLASGRCSFTVVDPGVELCEDGCCGPEDQMASGKAAVKFVGDDGKTLPGGPGEVFGVKPRTVVVVKGKASRDEQGNLTVVASGLHVRK